MFRMVKTKRMRITAYIARMEGKGSARPPTQTLVRAEKKSVLRKPEEKPRHR
jgi:hypothetical protein